MEGNKMYQNTEKVLEFDLLQGKQNLYTKIA